MTATLSAPAPDRTHPLARGQQDDPAPATPQAAPAPIVDVRRKALLRFAISISILNIVGHILLGFEQAPVVPLACLAVSYAVSLLLEAVDAWAHDRTPEFRGSRANLFYFLLPPHIAALACAMLLYANSLAPYLFATIVAAGSKYAFRVRVNGRLRHMLNPSNTGISVTLLLMPLVGFVPPYMFLNNTDQTFDWLIPVGVLMAGTMLNGKLTRKLPLIAGWVGGYILQAIVRSVFLGDNLASTLGMMTGVAFVLFTNYMITDPGTTPVDPRRQVIFGLSVAAVYGVLIGLGVAYAIFFALVIVCFLRGITVFLGQRSKAWHRPAQAVTP